MIEMVERVGPIRPEEVQGAKLRIIPSKVFECFNSLIVQNENGGASKVLQKDVIECIVDEDVSREDVFAKGWLNIEGAYRKAGWSVKYDKPGYNESYDAFFVFSRARRRELLEQD